MMRKSNIVNHYLFYSKHIDRTKLQVNHYYPYGSTFYGEKTSDQRFKYCGKELDKMHGLNWYDSSARYYDHVLGRFQQIDPLAEKYYPIIKYMT